jgi:UDP-N-acetylmuramyl pentapeptide phosphotransferase/UDP-N-acetylglucosamine-1-phosphate transferase
MKNLGIVLIVIGIVLMLFTGFTFVTKKNVADIGPIEINKEQRHSVPWSPITGGVLLIAGVVLVVSGKKRA